MSKNITEVTLNEIAFLPTYVPVNNADPETWAEVAQQAAEEAKEALEEIKDLAEDIEIATDFQDAYEPYVTKLIKGESLINGVGQSLLIQQGVIPGAIKLVNLYLLCSTDETDIVTTSALYAHVWEKVEDNQWKALGVSDNGVIQVVGELGAWEFKSLKTQGGELLITFHTFKSQQEEPDFTSGESFAYSGSPSAQVFIGFSDTSIEPIGMCPMMIFNYHKAYFASYEHGINNEIHLTPGQKEHLVLDNKDSIIDANVTINNVLNVGTIQESEEQEILNGTVITDKLISTKALEVEKDGKRVDLVSVIEKIGVDIGTQEEPFDDDTPTTGFATGVQKINFKGKYVNVIKTENDNEVTLWIQPNESVADFKDVSTPDTVNYILYDTDDYTLPVQAGNQTAVTQVVKEGTAFSDIVLNAQTANGESPVTIKNKEYTIWWRVNGGNTLGSFPIMDPETQQSKTGTVSTDGVSCNVIANTIWTNADAEQGKIPGQAEVDFNFTIATSILAPEGGNIKLEYVIQKDTPDIETTWSEVNLFVSKYNDPDIQAAKATRDTSSIKTIQVSGINYLCEGNKYNIEATGITNTQHKINRITNRIRLTDNWFTDKKYEYNDAALSRTDEESDNEYASTAVYTLNDTYTIGEIGIPGEPPTLTLYATKYNDTNNPTGVAKVINLENTYWGLPRLHSMGLFEIFQEERLRVKADNTTWTSATFDPNTDAVVQYGKAYHVAGTLYKRGYSGGTNDTGRWTSTATTCSFNRVFRSNSTDTCASIIISDASPTIGTPLNTSVLSSLVRSDKVDILLRGVKDDGTLEEAVWNCGKYSSETGSSAIVGILKEISDGKLVCTIAGYAFNKNKGCLIQVIIKDKAVAVSPFCIDLI